MPFAVCMNCVKLDNIWINFLNSFTTYDVYVVVDDNSIDYSEKCKDTRIKVIQIPNETCKAAGFFNMTMTLKREITAWDKAIYYFSTMNTTYDRVWFVEEDVFFHSEQTLLNIDAAHPSADLLTNRYSVNRTGGRAGWHWPKVVIQGIPPPYYSCMCCASRISSRLLAKMKEYADTHKTLFFLEVMFPTLCMHNKFEYQTPDTFRNIVWRRNHSQGSMNKTHLFHPIKNLVTQRLFRSKL